MTKQDVPSKKKPASPGTILLYLAAIFQATQFARAFHAIDSTSLWSDIGGLLAGLVVNLSLAYSATRLPRIKKKKEQQFAYAAFWALIIMTPLFLAPINFKTMGGFWAELWPVKLGLAIVSAMVVDIAIALVAFSDGSLISLGATLNDGEAKTSNAGSEGQRRSKSLNDAGSEKKGRSATLEAKLYRCECGETFTDRFKYSGHTRACPTRQALKASKDLTPIEIPAKGKVQS